MCRGVYFEKASFWMPFIKVGALNLFQG